MKVWNSFPMLRLVLPFLAGVVSWAFFLEFITVDLQRVLLMLVIISIISIVFAFLGYSNRRPYIYGIFLWPVLYAFGSLLTISISSFIFPDYLDLQSKQAKPYIAVVDDEPQIKQKSVKVVANITDINLTESGKVLLYFDLDSEVVKLKYGQEILIYTKLQLVEGMGNPNEFNYARYLRFHDIQFRGHVKTNCWKYLSEGNPGITGWFLDVRSKLIEKFEDAGLTGNELSVASALVLGYRTELDKELMSAYAGAGATHVLAVSGLHVGIVYIILNTALKFMDRRKSTRIAKTLLLIALLFGYAALTGLSASVFRAATMFSFVAIGKAIDRSTNIFNTLAASAFCLILYEPMIIMQVGFQLSYLAVIGIVVIQPKLFALQSFDNRLGDWAWSITCVSIAAQIATFPLGLLYFHQFPNLFLLSNLLVIPAAALILYLGFSLFVASIWKPALLFFGFLLDLVISTLNQVVVWIEQVPYSVLSGIDISTAEALIIYAIILGVLVFIVQKQRVGIYASLVLSIAFMLVQINEVYSQKHQRFVAVYNVKNETAIALVNGTHLTFIGSRELWEDEQAMLFHVRHHWWNKGIDSEVFVELNDTLLNHQLEWGGEKFAILSLKNPNTMKITSEPVNYGILKESDWNNCKLLQELDADTMIILNNFGSKMAERIQEFSSKKPTRFVSKYGTVYF